MKKFVFGLIALAMFGFTTHAQTKFVKIQLPKSVQSPAGLSETIVNDVSFKNASGVESRGQIRFVIPDSGDGLISLEFSENILTAGGIRNDFFVVNAAALEGEAGTGGTLSSCLKQCNIDFTRPDGTKIPGRGQCKAGCWLDATIRILPLVLTLIK